MKIRLLNLLLIVLLFPLVLDAQEYLEKRTALIIGNADYLNAPLNNTVNDARSMARALRKAGFDVILSEDVSNKDEMKMIIREFGKNIQQGGTALFYYSGHGLQVDGFNYIVPVNAVIGSEEEVEYECVDMGFLLAMMESRQSDINIVILDACRNNPFERSWSRSVNGSGLAFMDAPSGSIIAYSTSPGRTASDGYGRNGLYTSALLEHITEPGISIEEMFKKVREKVSEKSAKAQVPWESTSLLGNFYFVSSDQ